MPLRREPADPTKRNPTKVRAARKGYRWQLQGTVGNFEPERVPAKPDTVVLTKEERVKGVSKLDRATRYDYEKGEIVREQLEPAPGPIRPGGGRGRTERP